MVKKISAKRAVEGSHQKLRCGKQGATNCLQEEFLNKQERGTANERRITYSCETRMHARKEVPNHSWAVSVRCPWSGHGSLTSTSIRLTFPQLFLLYLIEVKTITCPLFPIINGRFRDKSCDAIMRSEGQDSPDTRNLLLLESRQVRFKLARM